MIAVVDIVNGTPLTTQISLPKLNTYLVVRSPEYERERERERGLRGWEARVAPDKGSGKKHETMGEERRRAAMIKIAREREEHR